MTAQDYLEDLRASGTLSPASFLASAYLLRRQTPAHTFSTLIMPVRDTQEYYVLTARDSFNETLGKGVFEFLAGRHVSRDLMCPITILAGLSCPPYAFDSVVVLGPVAHHKFQTENNNLHSRSFEIFPVFRCEFSGTEHPDLIDEIRHTCVDTLDWTRQPSPQVYIRFNNTKSQARTEGAKWVLTKIGPVLHELEELGDQTGSFVEIKNYKGEICWIIVRGDNFLATSPPSLGETRIPRTQIKNWTEGFLMK
jgi:hypothetical protein